MSKESRLESRVSVADRGSKRSTLEFRDEQARSASKQAQNNTAANALVAELENACRDLFDAYDVDESDELSREEFLQIECRLAIEKGEVVKEAPLFAQLTKGDTDGNGQLSYEEFRESQLRNFTEMGYSKKDILEKFKVETLACYKERQRMGPRYHAGIRSALKKIFRLYDVSGDNMLSPEEWIAAQKVVALEISDDIDEAWIDEAAFAAADLNGDGVLDLPEYLEASFSMFEVAKMNMESLEATLQQVILALEKRTTRPASEPLTIMMQRREKPEFKPPKVELLDENMLSTDDDGPWKPCGELHIPASITTADEVSALLRLSLKLPDTWLSMYYLGAKPGGGATAPVTLLRDANVQESLDYWRKASSNKLLYVKNVRPAPKKLKRTQIAFMDEREALLPKRTGSCWGLDWETQLVGEGCKCPNAPFVVMVGDAVVVEVPTTIDGGAYRLVNSIYIDGCDVLSCPVEEVIEPKAKKKKKKKADAQGDEPDPLIQLSFIALTEGTCVLFVDLSWEDQENRVAAVRRVTAPCTENTVARIGPIQVEVQKPQLGQKVDTLFQWWNGEKWSNKKGPAKRKKKR